MSATNGGQEAVIYIATLVTTGDISTGDLSSLCDRLAQAGCAPQVSVRIDGGRAADIAFQGGPSTARQSLDGAPAHTDAIVQPIDRTSVWAGKSLAIRINTGGRPNIKQKNKQKP